MFTVTTVSEQTDPETLVGLKVRTSAFDPFTILGASQAPELRAVAYTARDVEQDYLFIACLPWGQDFTSA